MRNSMTLWAAVGVASNILLASAFVFFMLLLVQPPAAWWRAPGGLEAAIGSAIGVLGGLAGGCASIFGAKGPREHAFVVKSSWVAWAVVTPFVAIMLASSSPYRGALWIPYGILLFLGVRHGNRAWHRIRQEETQGRGKP